MKKLFASVAVVAFTSLGVPVATAAGASALAPPAGGQLEHAWKAVCNTVGPDAVGSVSTPGSFDFYLCDWHFGSEVPTVFPETVGLKRLCNAMGGIYATLLFEFYDIWEQACTVPFV